MYLLTSLTVSCSAIRIHGKSWKSVEDYIGTRTSAQIRSHAQKYYLRVEKECGRGEDVGSKSLGGTMNEDFTSSFSREHEDSSVAADIPKKLVTFGADQRKEVSSNSHNL